MSRQATLAGGVATLRTFHEPDAVRATITSASDRHRIYVFHDGGIRTPALGAGARVGRTTFVPVGARLSLEHSDRPISGMELTATQEVVAEAGIAFGGECADFRRSGAAKVQAAVVGLQAAAAAAQIVQRVLVIAILKTVERQLHLCGRRDDAWLHPEALRNVLEHIESRVPDRISISDLCGLAGLGHSAFHRAFRGSVGTTPGDWVLDRLLAWAERLILDTDLTIAEISERCRFDTPAHFISTFRSRRSVQPVVWSRIARLANPI